MSIAYYSLDANFESCTTLKAKIAKIDIIISALYDTALKSVMNGTTLEYSIDTGQTKQKKIFTKPQDVTEAIKQYEVIRAKLVQKLIGGEYRNVDQQNLKRGYYNGLG